MTKNKKHFRRILSLLLSLVMVLSCVPAIATTAGAAALDTMDRVADTSTMDDWQKFFPTGTNVDLSTENAGGIWTDKSVFEDDTAFADITMTQEEKESNFLVALSAMGSNMTITGMSNVPSDTMLVLDVSGSMQNSGAALVNAANTTIQALLDTNPKSRVGVVLYSGPSSSGSSTGINDAVLTLPLDRYTTTDSQDRYLNYSSGYVYIDSDVEIEGANTAPSSTGKSIVGGTYIQTGVNLAMDQFTAEGNETTVTDSNLGVIKRKPILVLMSDGAPTLGSTDFTDPTDSNLGNGQRSSAAMGFVTQLSMAYARQQIEKKYQQDALVYTLSVGLTTSTTGYNIARAVLNPTNTYTNSSANALRTNWTTYQNLATGGTMTVSDNRQVKKIAEPLDMNYVDEYFAASNATGLVSAFQEIVSRIALQSKYFPTLTQENENLSGYVTFVDKIGKYMEVKHVEGIRLHQTLFSGRDLASNFVPSGGDLGTIANPKEPGKQMVDAVMERMGITDRDTARTLIRLAYERGQLAYNRSTGEFSNYIGWVADSAGAFLGFWYEGMDPSTIPSAAAYIMRSYGYFGETDESHGVTKSNMLYTTVQLREDIQSGEQQITFAIPAALLPTVTYHVTLNETGDPTNLTTSGATAPIRLVYQVGLQEGINEFTVGDLVDSQYLADNTEAGEVSFYTNQYETDNSVGFDESTGQVKNNTYAYFRPSRENDRYYYQQPSLVYTDESGTLYRGDSRPTTNMYHRYTVYEKVNGGFRATLKYHKLTDESLAATQKTNDTDKTWFVPEGTVRRDYAGWHEDKLPSNQTGTLPWSAVPFTDIHGHTVDDTGHYFVVGSTLGNNGKLTLDRETGIKITKQMAPGVAVPDTQFQFTVENTTDPTDNTAHPAYRTDADGTGTDTTVQFTGGTAQVFLKAGQTLYIGGISSANVIRVREQETDMYTVQSGNGTNLTVQANEMAPAEFVNALRGQGNLTIAKDVVHSLGSAYQIPDGVNSFQFTVTLMLNGQPLADRSYNGGQIQTDENGQFSLPLKAGEQVTVEGLPAGTEATVVENTPPTGFAVAYWDDAQLGDGVVTIADGTTSTVVAVNHYTSQPVQAQIPVSVTKTLAGDLYTGSFSFTLQRALYNLSGEITGWQDIETKSVSYTSQAGDKQVAFADLTDTYDEVGNYVYRIVEANNGDPSVLHDTHIHSFNVRVTDKDMDGKLEISTSTAAGEEGVYTTRSEVVSVTQSGGVWSVDAKFTNTHTNVSTAAVTIDLQKQVVNAAQSRVGNTLNGYQFVLTDTATNTPVQTLSTNTRGGLRFGLTYTAADLGGQTSKTFTYTLSEVTPAGYVEGEGPWHYDDKVITVTVEVTLDQNIITAVVTDDDTNTANADSAIDVSFQNRYTPGNLPLEVDFVSKALTGRDLKAEEFSFQITGFSGTPLYNSAFQNVGAVSGKNLADGTVVFDHPLYFNREGTYFYTVTETGGTAGGVTYDGTVHQVTVTVTDVNGVLTPTYRIESAQGDQVIFRNTYTPGPVEYAITGTKVLTGRSLLNDEFTFVLTPVQDENGTPIPGGTVRYALNGTDPGNPNQGSFTFPAISYDKTGTYYYAVTEQPPAGTNTYGVSYDGAEYIVAVTVTDPGTGKLRAASAVVKGGQELKFQNTYTPAHTTASIPGSKLLEGRVLNDEEFRFALFHSNAAWEQKEQADVVKNTLDANGEGVFSFDDIQFSAAGTYYYLVTELDDQKGGVEYDDAVYRVRIEITDDKRGQLHSNVFLFDSNGIPQAEIEFLNLYTVSGNSRLTLEGTKTLEGKDLLDYQFVFELFETDDTFAITGEPAMTATNQNGKFSFSYQYDATQVGNTYYYAVREKNAGQTIDNITYADTVYHITVQVEDDGLGGVKTSATILDGQTASKTLDFVNTYEAPKPPAQTPETGDEAPVLLWLVCLMLGFCGMAATVCWKKKEEAGLK